MKKIKIAYIGGGSKEWAKVFLNDLAQAKGISGELALYDIDLEAAKRNQKIGQRINKLEKTVSQWDYQVYEKIGGALINADFVAISILPGTFDEMMSDVHAPETYGIYQSVGDTVGPGGVIRSMRTVPIFEFFAQKIKEYCPNAWVLNFTNPMTICVKTLYDVFPEIKAFGCCHEVFHTQDFLCKVLEEEKGIKVHRNEIYTDVTGINHFTWFTKAKYQDIDLLKLLPSFTDKCFETGFNENGSPDLYLESPFAQANRVKMDLYKQYGILPAAGDRHLVEFLNHNWYLKDKKTIDYWKFALTTVDFRIELREKRIKELQLEAEGKKDINLYTSDEEAIELIKAILGFNQKVSNVNMVNLGQVKDLPIGSVVETNAVFTNDQVIPLIAKPLPVSVKNLVLRNANNIETLYEGIKKRDLNQIFESFMNQPLLDGLTIVEAEMLFKEMIENTRTYLDQYFNIDQYLNN
ncbi:MAG: alpha-glucosidase/alpha-galactosidase [Tenericutes bacterium]|nr:alpha-glucosidase/alpha-galactosidase [Mycoplasmatota bacterium]